MSDKPTLLFDVLDALEDALKHCAPDKRRALADTLDAYSEDCDRIRVFQQPANAERTAR